MYLEWKWRLGKLRVLSGKQVCAILAYHGFIEMWQRGSPECILYFQATSFIYRMVSPTAYALVLPQSTPSNKPSEWMPFFNTIKPCSTNHEFR